MRKSKAFKQDRHRKQKVKHEAKRAAKRVQASVGRQTAPASQRGKQFNGMAVFTTALKTWSGVRMRHLDAALAKVWTRIEQKIDNVESVKRAA